MPPRPSLISLGDRVVCRRNDEGLDATAVPPWLRPIFSPALRQRTRRNRSGSEPGARLLPTGVGGRNRFPRRVRATDLAGSGPRSYANRLRETASTCASESLRARRWPAAQACLGRGSVASAEARRMTASAGAKRSLGAVGAGSRSSKAPGVGDRATRNARATTVRPDRMLS